MAPPKFADLGKSAKDLLTKDFAVGETKVELSSRASNGTEFKKTIVRPHGINSKGANATAELKYFYAPNNVTVTEKWMSANIITQTVAIDKLVEGLKVDVETSYNIANGNIAGLLKFDHIKDKLHSTLDIDLNRRTGNASLVVSHEGVLVGFQGLYDTDKGALASRNAAVAYQASDLTVTALTDGERLSASLFHRAGLSTLVGLQLNAQRGSSDTSYMLGAQYAMDKDATVKARISQTGEAAIAYTQVLRPGVKATFGMSLDTQNLQTDAHKIGFALTINA